MNFVIHWNETAMGLYYWCSVAQSCPTLCDPIDCSTPGFHVHHQLLELAQTQVHWVDGINWCQWWQPTISSSVIPFSSCLQCFLASGSIHFIKSDNLVEKHTIIFKATKKGKKKKRPCQLDWYKYLLTI